jgi:DNA polymerase-3 subunit beta
MRFSISRADLAPVLAVVGGVVERRHTKPILGNILLSAEDGVLRLQGTDQEIEIRTVVEAKVEEPGAVTVPARKLIEIVRSLPDDGVVDVKTQGQRVSLHCLRSRFSLGTLPAADFPTMAMPEPDVAVQVSREMFRRLLDKTSFAMAHQDVRYYLNGVLMEVGSGRIVLVATDGHRLAKMVGVLDEGAPSDAEDITRQVILPSKTVLELKRLLSMATDEVLLRFSDRTLEVQVGSTVVVSKLVEGQYPDYHRVIPSQLTNRATVDRDLLRGALQRTAILSNEKYRGVRMGFSPGRLSFQAQNPENEEAEDEVEIAYDGDPVTIGFNVGYVMDVLSAVDVEQLEVEFSDGEKSAIWRGLDAEDELFVIMPMRL